MRSGDVDLTIAPLTVRVAVFVPLTYTETAVPSYVAARNVHAPVGSTAVELAYESEPAYT
jgi:hypothetical protein